MIPGRYNLSLYRGDTFRRSFALWHDAERTEAVDLTGATVASEMRDKPAGALVVAFGVVVTLPNVVGIELTPADWEANPVFPQHGVWDLEVTFPSDDVATPLAGSTEVVPDVTNSTP